MKSITELPLNYNAQIQSDIGMAGLYSLMTADAYGGEINSVISEFSIKQNNERKILSENNLKICKNNMDIEYENGRVKFLSEPLCPDKYAYIYEQVDKLEQVELKVEYIQKSNAWNTVSLVLSNGITGYDNVYSIPVYDNEYSLKITANGAVVIHTPEIHKCVRVMDIDEYKNVYLRISLKDKLRAEYSFDYNKWTCIYENEQDTGGINSKQVGVCISPQMSQFYNEFYSTHLQLCYSTTTKSLVYHAEFDERKFSDMLECYYVPSETVMGTDENVVDYFTNLIDKKYYVRLRLDEFYIPKSFSYKKIHQPHINFIYGYDMENSVFKLMGYNKKLTFTELVFKDFILSFKYEKHLKDKIVLYKYISKANTEKFPLGVAIGSLEAYLNGENSYYMTKYERVIIENNDSFVYGINIQKLITENSQHMEYFIKDIRLICRIQEHYYIVKKMIEILKWQGILEEEWANLHGDAFGKLYTMSYTIKKILMKNYVKPNTDISIQIKNRLHELMENDILSTARLVKDLKILLKK